MFITFHEKSTELFYGPVGTVYSTVYCFFDGLAVLSWNDGVPGAVVV